MLTALRLASTIPQFRTTNTFLPLNSRLPSYPSSCICCSSALHTKQHNVIFLGTPQVAADVLGSLLDAASSKDSTFQVTAVVTQPPATRGRGYRLLPSPVAQLALERDFPASKVLCPENAREESFLLEVQELKPNVCVTAAYGNILPKKFLQIPTFGTINIHPSLLPQYRGAAPVQRALQEGVKEMGVTVAYTVLAMDAGPIITAESVKIDDCIKAPELLTLLFHKGTSLLLKELPAILDGSAAKRAQDQDHSRATYAPKVHVDESLINFEESAVAVHNKVRAFAGWPGTKAKFRLFNLSGEEQELELKIITTKVSSSMVAAINEKDSVILASSALVVSCGDGSALEILELQPPGKRVMTGRDFLNGLHGKKLKRL